MLPLQDIRVVAVEQFGAGPWATLQLADLGAEVIKIEDPAFGIGDEGRTVPPFQEGDSSLFFETFNRNKKSVSLDLRHPAGRSVFEDIVRRSDAVFTNVRGDLPEKMGLTYGQLKSVNPRIVCCSLSAFGRTGPRSAQGAYDYVIQGHAGWMSLTGEPDSPPTRSGLPLVDLSAGYVSTIALLAGVWQARRDGVGCDCDVSMFETALAELIYVGTWVATRGWRPVRRPNSAHPSIIPFQNFATSDGWIVVACPKQRLWERLCETIGQPQLLADPRFTDFNERDRHRRPLLEILERAFLERSTEEWLEALTEAGIPSAPVNDVATALSDPQVVARDAIVEVDHPRLGLVREVGTPLRVGNESKPVRRAPFRGEHTDEVLIELCGYSADDLAELAGSGVFGDSLP